MVVLSREDPDAPCALAICAPLTTAYRGSECEVDVGKPRFLRMHSYVNVQGLQAVQHQELNGPLGILRSESMTRVRAALRYALEI